jgi:hypothetical protein
MTFTLNVKLKKKESKWNRKKIKERIVKLKYYNFKRRFRIEEKRNFHYLNIFIGRISKNYW